MDCDALLPSGRSYLGNSFYFSSFPRQIRKSAIIDKIVNSINCHSTVNPRVEYKSQPEKKKKKIPTFIDRFFSSFTQIKWLDSTTLVFKSRWGIVKNKKLKLSLRFDCKCCCFVFFALSILFIIIDRNDLWLVTPSRRCVFVVACLFQWKVQLHTSLTANGNTGTARKEKGIFFSFEKFFKIVHSVSFYAVERDCKSVFVLLYILSNVIIIF